MTKLPNLKPGDRVIRPHAFRRRTTSSADRPPIPTASNPKAEGSGMGKVTLWKASPVGTYNPEAKVLCAPLGANSYI